MNKTKIEWCDYTINPVKGLCPVACDYCYARRMYKRFGWNPEIRRSEKIEILPRNPSRIFVGSTMELFGDWIKEEWLEELFCNCQNAPQHTFIFLTKRPENLIKWSPFPENCWIGVSATNWLQFSDALGYLATVKAKVRFLSFEPLFERIQLDMLQKMLFPRVINWVIIGQQTPIKVSTTPKIEWVQEIVEACDKADAPVFLKNNLKDFIYGEYGGKYKQIFRYTQDGGRELRQEYPLLALEP